MIVGRFIIRRDAEADLWVSYSSSDGVWSQGRTPENALAAILDACRLRRKYGHDRLSRNSD